MAVITVSATSEEQLSTLLAKLKEDAGLQEKLKCTADLDVALAIAKEAGFDVDKVDWFKAQASKALEMSNKALEMSNKVLEMSDKELTGVAGGRGDSVQECFSRECVSKVVDILL